MVRLILNIILKTGLGWSVQPVRLGTGYSSGPVPIKNPIALLMESTPVEQAGF